MSDTQQLDGLKALAAEMRAQQDHVEQLEEVLKQAKAILDKLRLIQIPNEMERLELRTATFEGIGRVQLAADLYCSTKEGKKEECMQWLRDQGLDDMITESYNASSLKALIRRQIAEGIEAPEFLNVTPFTRASIVKAG